MKSSDGVNDDLGQWDGTDSLFNPLSALFSDIILHMMQ